MARSRTREKPAQVIEVGGGDTVPGRGPSCGREEEAPSSREEQRLGGDERNSKEHLLQVESIPCPPPTPGRKSYSKEASLQDWWKNLEAPPPSQGSESGKSCQAQGPASPVVLPTPSPPAAEAGAAPPPARRPLSRPAGRALGLLVPLTESRLLPYPAHLRERLRRFSPDPSSGHGSHTPPLVPHSLSLTHTHSATTAPERPTYYTSLACYVLCARA